MKQISGKEFIRIIQKRGWILKRVNGSHHIFIKAAIGNAGSFRFTAISR